MKLPKIFIFSGPGGAGKTVLINKLFDKKYIQSVFMKGITVTTRTKRPREKEGKDYFFVSKEEFLRLKKKKFFLESQKILDDYYGIPKLFYALAKAGKKHLILCIDVKGGMYLKKHLKAGRITTIFIAAPTEKELYRRMKKRAEGKEVIERRTMLAKKELQFSQYYDYVIVNKDIKKSLKKIEDIVKVNCDNPAVKK